MAVEIKSNFDFGVRIPKVDWINAVAAKSVFKSRFLLYYFP